MPTQYQVNLWYLFCQLPIIWYAHVGQSNDYVTLFVVFQEMGHPSTTLDEIFIFKRPFHFQVHDLEPFFFRDTYEADSQACVLYVLLYVVGQ